ncbi:MAG: tyrosine-type recombinase/integrase [Oscillospiraceae bacterium]
MESIHELTAKYIDYCQYQKSLNLNTLKAYKIDLAQFESFFTGYNAALSKALISEYVVTLHKNYKPKSAKRKIASLKAFFSYLEYEELIAVNPFAKMKVRFQEPTTLPRTISSFNLQRFFNALYACAEDQPYTSKQQHTTIRDIAIFELLFGTGMRISELCNLRLNDLDLQGGNVRIFGKGSKERVVQLTNTEIIIALERHFRINGSWSSPAGHLFANRLNERLSEQSVRNLIRKYCSLASISEHITPHMFRHTFASLLLEENVDIRYIQSILGHSSITTTQIYTHVSSGRQREILVASHPRNKITLSGFNPDIPEKLLD